MNLTQEKALFHLTGKLNLGAAETKILKSVAEEAPYFAPARFLLTAGLKQTHPYEQWMPHAQKTNLYFTNPNWLQYQLEDVRKQLARATAPVVESPVFKESFKQPALTPPVQEEAPAEAVHPPREHIAEMEPEASIEQETIAAIEHPEAVETPATKENTEPNDTDQPKDLAAPEVHPLDFTPIDEETDPGDPDETDYTEEPVQPLETEGESKISGILSTQLADFRKPVAEDASLEIDADRKPLHTVDYFVSQGIKVDLSAMPQDKLTTHLRKFTDWLKQVKSSQNHTNPQDLGTNLEMEKAVAETARNSNETREVVTESMADVLVKQGQVEKAIQLYIKLSFLNPEKSSYFAAKIEQLKGI